MGLMLGRSDISDTQSTRLELSLVMQSISKYRSTADKIACVLGIFAEFEQVCT